MIICKIEKALPPENKDDMVKMYSSRCYWVRKFIVCQFTLYEAHGGQIFGIYAKVGSTLSSMHHDVFSDEENMNLHCQNLVPLYFLPLDCLRLCFPFLLANAVSYDCKNITTSLSASISLQQTKPFNAFILNGDLASTSTSLPYAQQVERMMRNSVCGRI